MITLRKVLNNRYFIITKQIEGEVTSLRKSDLVVITEGDLVSFCRNNMVIECPDHINSEMMPKDLKAVTYHLRQGRKNMLLKQNYNDPPEE
jgi:hypothetical protein